MDAVNLRFQYTEEVSVRATIAMTRRQYFNFPCVSGYSLIAGVATFLLVRMKDPNGQNLLGSLLASAVAILWVVFVMWAFLPLFARLHARRIFRRLPSANQEIRWSITAEKLDCEAADIHSSFKWSRLIKAVETKSGFLLYPHPRMAHWLPREAFASPAELELFRGFVTTNKVKFERARGVRA